jgi:type IV secretory pathway TrbD component
MMGVERKLFFFALVMGAAVFNLLHTFLGGLLMFGLLYGFARWATKTDPQLLRFLLNSTKARCPIRPHEIRPHPDRGEAPCLDLQALSSPTAKPAR